MIVLGREIDRRMRELEELREVLRPVAARYRALYRETIGGPRRIDHLGAASHRERGWSALAAGELEEAIVGLRSALEMDPHDARTQALLAWGYAGAGEGERAAALLRELLSADPHDPLGRMVLGYLALTRGRFEEALEELEPVTRQGLDATASLYAHLYLGMAYAELGMGREGLRMLRRALERAPNLTEAYWVLGRYHLREGRPDLALEVWRVGADNRFSAWGERCRAAAERLEEGEPSEPL